MRLNPNRDTQFPSKEGVHKNKQTNNEVHTIVHPQILVPHAGRDIIFSYLLQLIESTFLIIGLELT